jgi:hypothetical protein
VIQQCRTAQIIDLERERIRRQLGAALAKGAGKEGGGTSYHVPLFFGVHCP